MATQRLPKHDSTGIFSAHQRDSLAQCDVLHRQQIEVTWRVDVTEFPGQLHGASPRALFPMGREDGTNWWVPVQMLASELGVGDSGPDAAETGDLKSKIAGYFLNQVPLFYCYSLLLTN